MPSFAVTGGTGFLGVELIRQLLADAENESGKVIVVARSGLPEDLEKHERVVFAKGSVMDIETLEKACAGVSAIFHLAGIVEHSRRNPQSMYDLHIQGTKNVIQAAAKLSIKRVVYASTSGVVGCSQGPDYVASEQSPYIEDLAREWPYYHSKIVAEREALELSKQLGVELICMRPSLLLGPGDYRLSSCRGVYDFMKGNIPIMPSGGLSFVDVRDTAIAFRSAVTKAKPYGTYLLGSTNMTLGEYFDLLEKVTKVGKPRLWAPDVVVRGVASFGSWVLGLFGKWDPSLDPVLVEMSQHYWYLDNSAAKTDLGFNPRDPKVTIEETVSWIRENEATLTL
eukprot:TRINITY_DN10009_c0_g1_i1.p1 TRINITY_DN10009_c0_g1~~TRINITY_DN10009_c0_g1_i1.p1  ORF type:complete len:339 (-),score=74.39 TRINITY_DN10009_c0_g1_i1:106-1122(-)